MKQGRRFSVKRTTPVFSYVSYMQGLQQVASASRIGHYGAIQMLYYYYYYYIIQGMHVDPTRHPLRFEMPRGRARFLGRGLGTSSSMVIFKFSRYRAAWTMSNYA